MNYKPTHISVNLTKYTAPKSVRNGDDMATRLARLVSGDNFAINSIKQSGELKALSK